MERVKGVVLAEKPSVAKDIAPFFGPKQVRQQGYIEVSGGDGVWLISHSYGHITELADADVYLPEGIPKTKRGSKVWRREDLPVLPQRFVVNVTEPKQFKVIKDLLAIAKKDGAEIWHAGDPDREGQLLIDRVLELCNVDPDGDNVRRILPSALDDASIRKMLSNVRYNKEFANLRAAAKARAFADWEVGINGTRALTLANNGLISVGRVMTPVAALVVRRDRLIKNFKPQKYYVPYVVMQDGARLTWRSRKELVPGIDEAGRILDKALAERILSEAQRGAWLVQDAKQHEVKSPPPLPHNLASLQQQLMNTHKIPVAKTLEAAQSLYQDHKLTTYPRTDCRYLPGDQFADRAAILRAVSSAIPKEVNGSNPALQSKCWDTSKVSAHHAIIPTGKTPNLSSLGDIEKRAYEAICRQYVAQFYPDAVDKKTSLTIEFNQQDTFAVEETAMVSPGWKTVLGGVKQPVAKEDMKPTMEEDFEPDESYEPEPPKANRDAGSTDDQPDQTPPKGGIWGGKR